MSQNDLSIANQGFASFRSDLNSALQALGSTNSGTSAPSTTYANQLFYDTTNNILKIRNEDNDAFITLFTLDQANDNIESLIVNGAFQADSVAVDLLTIDGQEIDVSSGDLTLDVAGDIILDADGSDISLRDGGTEFGRLSLASSGLQIFVPSSDADLFIKGNDGGSTITALTLDMSDAGKATFNNAILVADGTSSLPSFGFSGDSNTGLFRAGGDAIGFSTGGSERARVDNNGTLLIGKTTPANSAGAGDIQGASAGAVNYELRSDSAGIQFGTTSNHYLAFRTNNAEEMRIDATGHLMLNTTSERNSGNLSIDFDGSSQGAQGLNDTTSGNGSVFIGFLTGGTFRGSITNNNNSAVAFNTTSDYRLKESVKYDWEATTRLKKLKPINFNFIADKDNTIDGFLAHEAQEVVPQAITGTKDETKTTKNVVLDKDENIIGTDITEDEWKTKKEDGTYSDDTSWKASITQKHYQQIDHSKLVPLLTKTILELEEELQHWRVHNGNNIYLVNS